MSCGSCWYQHLTIVWVSRGQHEIGEVKLRRVKIEGISKCKVMKVSLMYVTVLELIVF
jgi:hypothetical protein